MSEYKCIVCGEIRDGEKQCTCPSCGYMMFETPYDRSKILRSEISRFLTGLLNMEIDIDTLEFCRVDDKDEKVYISDDNNNRFPDADIITDYILSALIYQEKAREYSQYMIFKSYPLFIRIIKKRILSTQLTLLKTIVNSS